MAIQGIYVLQNDVDSPSMNFALNKSLLVEISCINPSSSKNALLPSSILSCLIVVKDGVSWDAIGKSSKPITLISSGT